MVTEAVALATAVIEMYVGTWAITLYPSRIKSSLNVTCTAYGHIRERYTTLIQIRILMRIVYEKKKIFFWFFSKSIFVKG